MIPLNLIRMKENCLVMLIDVLSRKIRRRNGLMAALKENLPKKVC